MKYNKSGTEADEGDIVFAEYVDVVCPEKSIMY